MAWNLAGIKNKKNPWNKDKSWCECRELIDQGIRDKRFFGIQVMVNVNMINHVMLKNV